MTDEPIEFHIRTATGQNKDTKKWHVLIDLGQGLQRLDPGFDTEIEAVKASRKVAAVIDETMTAHDLKGSTSPVCVTCQHRQDQHVQGKKQCVHCDPGTTGCPCPEFVHPYEHLGVE